MDVCPSSRDPADDQVRPNKPYSYEHVLGLHGPAAHAGAQRHMDATGRPRIELARTDQDDTSESQLIAR